MSGRQALQNVPTLREDCIHRINSSWMFFAISAFDDTSNVTWPFGLIAENFPHAESSNPLELLYADVTCSAGSAVSLSPPAQHMEKFCSLENHSAPAMFHAAKACSAHPTFSNHPSGELQHKTAKYKRYDAMSLNFEQFPDPQPPSLFHTHHTGTNLLKNKNHTTITSKNLSQYAMNLKLKRKPASLPFPASWVKILPRGFLYRTPYKWN